jgi:opacity protein-like surface antigen
MRIATNVSFLLIALTIGLALPAYAQRDEPKVRLTVGGGTTAGAIDGEAAVNFSVGYRFSKLFSFDVEVVGINGSANEFSIGLPNFTNLSPNLERLIPIPVDFSVSNDGNTILSTMGFRFEFPTEESRFHPYVSGGMGLARTEENYDVRILAPTTRPQNMASTSIFADGLTHTGLAAGGGVGAQIRVWKGLSVGADARYYRLDRGRNLGTFGGSISYGF